MNSGKSLNCLTLQRTLAPEPAWTKFIYHAPYIIPQIECERTGRNNQGRTLINLAPSTLSGRFAYLSHQVAQGSQLYPPTSQTLHRVWRAATFDFERMFLLATVKCCCRNEIPKRILTGHKISAINRNPFLLQPVSAYPERSPTFSEPFLKTFLVLP
jgi:hypothetical protein